MVLRLREEYSTLPGRPDVTEAKAFLSQLNMDKNRYIDIPCLDKTRVKLQQQKVDYIHANWVECPELNAKVIMCQAPLDITTEDFYHMLYQEKVALIACLTKVTEGGVEKSYPYWPVVEGKQITFGKYSLKALSSSQEESCCNVTALELTKQDNKQSQKITHILYTDWTDHKAPNCTKFNGLKTNNTLPTAVIHCSAGIGRSGTLAALLRLQKTIENGQAPNIRSVVQQLRQQRALAVQGIEQYIFIYRTLMEMTYKLERRPKQSLGELLKHINALRTATEKSDLQQKHCLTLRPL
ncbi:Receptor type tyrosine protein phosphatase [Trichuris trichiura]|uniref:Receptor type tyrosine protein phosphatase n=1 Tax=Trichuris trichiura TaxID=36087 RepID=A0A077Z172_TRITR|nr:Receptor type tyrosine protein phosphatase [Trichuris trichiura]